MSFHSCLSGACLGKRSGFSARRNGRQKVLFWPHHSSEDMTTFNVNICAKTTVTVFVVEFCCVWALSRASLGK
eukprot:COSAG06_NODE_3492_length_5270_cov_2.545736_5_plen_73_part_00